MLKKLIYRIQQFYNSSQIEFVNTQKNRKKKIDYFSSKTYMDIPIIGFECRLRFVHPLPNQIIQRNFSICLCGFILWPLSKSQNNVSQ